MDSKDCHQQMSGFRWGREREGSFLRKSRKNMIILYTRGNENVRSHYSSMDLVNALICPFSLTHDDDDDDDGEKRARMRSILSC